MLKSGWAHRGIFLDYRVSGLVAQVRDVADSRVDGNLRSPRGLKDSPLQLSPHFSHGAARSKVSMCVDKNKIVVRQNFFVWHGI